MHSREGRAFVMPTRDGPWPCPARVDGPEVAIFPTWWLALPAHDLCCAGKSEDGQAVGAATGRVAAMTAVRDGEAGRGRQPAMVHRAL